MKSKSRQWWKLGFWVVLCLMVGFLGSLVTTPSIATGWYASLTKPFFAPPNWIFGPVWTLLFILMGVAAYLVSIEKNLEKKGALLVFGLQLGFNFFWSFLFFYLRRPDWAFVEIVGLWLLIWQTRKRFVKITRLAGQLLIPYLVWVGFASLLNLTIAIFN
jgi:translocator protein